MFRGELTFSRDQPSDVVETVNRGRGERCRRTRVCTAALLSPFAGGRGKSPVLEKRRVPRTVPVCTHACFALRMTGPRLGNLGGVRLRGLDMQHVDDLNIAKSGLHPLSMQATGYDYIRVWIV